uniref:Mobile element protein n=1 Tax=Escherichia coli TaxID=562 RepID=A0A288XFT8_ECOLX|nr:Mobile element protein [Escherichia coli]
MLFVLNLVIKPVGAFLWCAGHAQQLGGESPLSSLMVAKDS